MKRKAFIALFAGLGAWFATKFLPHKANPTRGGIEEFLAEWERNNPPACASCSKSCDGKHTIYSRANGESVSRINHLCEPCYTYYSSRPPELDMPKWIEWYERTFFKA